MSGLKTPPRFLPPISPARAVSPSLMSPVRRGGRAAGSSEDLRDLSPATTLRAFTEQPMPFDTQLDEYKIFACIDNLTPADRDLGARVAKAAQRLKSWCDEIEEWGWSGRFEAPSDAVREKRRQHIEADIRVHDPSYTEPPLEYWGSLLSSDVKHHEARLDDISDEMLTLDIEELKEHVLDIHGPNKSRPSSAGYGEKRLNYNMLDDFSFLITQTLLSALPHHFELKERLSTWTARVSVLRIAPQYLEDLQTSQKAMRLAWGDPIEPPADTSDASFNMWKVAIDTISGVLHDKVNDLGRRLDRMLDTLEGREDILPDRWIDNFESLEADFGQWKTEARRRIIEVDVGRLKLQGRGTPHGSDPSGLGEHFEEAGATPTPSHAAGQFVPKDTPKLDPHIASAKQADDNTQEVVRESSPNLTAELHEAEELDDSVFEEGDTVVHNDIDNDDHDSDENPSSFSEMVQVRPPSDSFSESPIVVSRPEQTNLDDLPERPQTPRSRRGSIDSISSDITGTTSSPPSLIEESPSVRKTTNRAARTPQPALNAAMTKRRPATRKVKETDMDSTPPWPPTKFANQLSPSSSDDLESKISDILTTIPAHIRLKSGNGADVNNRKISGKGSKNYLRAARSINGMKSPELTLSPVKQDFDSAHAAAGRKSAAAMRGDNDIKLYHLTQPGKEQPIKLFIRRVGENGERVMVRVGGGWADLGEYLRQYAEHHGRRTVSEGKFEILGLEIKNPEGSPRPESVLGKQNRRFSGGAVTPNASPQVTPQKGAAGLGITKAEGDSNPKATPPVFNNGSGENSAPSTGSSRHSWTGNEVGLAGPKAKKLELTDDKKEWVAGMMKQARTVSGNITSAPKEDERAESRSESRAESRTGGRPGQKGGRKSDFGDLGKIGGTKRVFLRGGGNEH